AAAQIPVDRLAFPITERVHGPGYDEHLAIRWDLVVLSGKGQGVHLDVVLLEDGGEVAISGVLGVGLDVVFAVAGEKQHAAAAALADGIDCGSEEEFALEGDRPDLLLAAEQGAGVVIAKVTSGDHLGVSPGFEEDKVGILTADGER